MCWMCEHPGATYEDHIDHMRGLMVRHGWAVQGVQGDRLHPPYSYTLGLTECGLPELVVTGLALRQAGALLNRVAEHLVHAGAPAGGEASQFSARATERRVQPRASSGFRVEAGFNTCS